MRLINRYGFGIAVTLVAAVLSLASCYREPIYKPLKNVRIQFKLDLSVNDSAQWVKPDPEGPSLIKVNFYNPQTHKLEGFMYTTRKGGPISGVGAGTYDIVAFNDDCEYTRITGESSRLTLQAYTDKIATKIKSKNKNKAKGEGNETKEGTKDATTKDGGDIDESTAITMPDHLLVAREMAVEIPEVSTKDTALVIEASMKTIIESYLVRIDSLHGIENINTVDLYLSGHAMGNFFGQGKRAETPVILHVPCVVDLADYCIRAKATTFGKIMETSGWAKLHLVVGGADGSVYDFEKDITQHYLRTDHYLHFFISGDIKSRGQSGFRPQVQEWEETERMDIDLH